jgi:hypothetical protein
LALAAIMALGPSANGSETFDELLVRVEEKAPGFGGMYIEKDGRLAVYLLDVSQIAIARSAIATVFGADRVPASGVRALQGQYTVTQLKRWTERATEMLQASGVTIVDLDESNNRVAIGIAEESVRSALEQALAPLGIPRAAIAIAVTGEITPVDRERGTKRAK